MKNKLLFIMLATLFFSSCRKDDIVDTSTNPPPAAEVFFAADIIGKVVDQDGAAIDNATVTVDNITVSTDVNGLFRWEDLTMGANAGTFLEAKAEGYFESGYRIYAGGTYNRTVEITLVRKEISGYVNGTTGNAITLDGGLEIDFPANAFTTSNGDFDGLVTVHAYHLDPSEDGYLDRSPGDLSGTDDTGASYILESFGMVAVEMETADGQYVQLREGVEATLTVPVASELIGDAPSEIPLWHFDDIMHKWVKEGTATLIDGSYVGKVSHFSWWNCDDFEQAASLCVQIFDGRYIGSLEGIIVELTSETQGTSTGATDTEGNVSGLIPAGESLLVTVYDQCGEVVYSGSIGPFSGNDNKEVIPVTLNNVEIYAFSGTVFDCETMSPLSDAIITMYLEGNTYYVETNDLGIYTVSLLVCNENAEYAVSAFSADAGMAGAESGIATLAGINVLDINLCNETPFMVIYDADGSVLMNSLNVEAHEKPNETILFTDLASTGGSLGFNGNSIGTFPASFFDGGSVNADNENCTVTITQYEGGIGGIVEGTVTGTNALTGNSFTGSFVAIIVQ